MHPTFVGSAQNPLAAQEVIVAEDFRDQVLITYPMGRDKLDAFTELLTPAQVEPRAQRQVELTAVILMLVGSNRGVAVLPDWVIREVKTNADYVTRPLGPGEIDQAHLCGDAGGGRDQALHGAFPAAVPQRAGQAAARLKRRVRDTAPHAIGFQNQWHAPGHSCQYETSSPPRNAALPCTLSNTPRGRRGVKPTRSIIQQKTVS